MNDLLAKARTLRKNQTPQERKMWNLLRHHRFYGFEFRRQYIIDNYIVDFVCLEKMLVIELDGGQHNETANIKYDTRRTKYIESKGFKVIRFWNDEIDNDINGVYDCLKSELL